MRLWAGKASSVEGREHQRWHWEFLIGWDQIGFQQVVTYIDGQTRPVNWYMASYTRRLAWGGSHFWYDGPHCNFSIGPIHFNWRNDSCKKCAAGF